MGGKKEEEEQSRGRPRLILDREQIARMASIQCSVKEIATVMGCSEKTIYDNYGDSVAQGRAMGKVSLRRKQWDVANEGNPTMLVWLGKNWLDQTDAKQTDADDNKPLPWDDQF